MIIINLEHISSMEISGNEVCAYTTLPENVQLLCKMGELIYIS